MSTHQRFLQWRDHWEGNAVLCYAKRFYVQVKGTLWRFLLNKQKRCHVQCDKFISFLKDFYFFTSMFTWQQSSSLLLGRNCRKEPLMFLWMQWRAECLCRSPFSSVPSLSFRRRWTKSALTTRTREPTSSSSRGGSTSGLINPSDLFHAPKHRLVH